VGNPFFEGVKFRRDLTEGQELERLLEQVFGSDGLALAAEVPLDTGVINAAVSPRELWRQLLDTAAKEGKLDKLLDRVLARPIHPTLASAIAVVRSAVAAPAASPVAAVAVRRLDHAVILELQQLLIARSFVTPDKVDLLLTGLPPMLVASRPHGASDAASQLLTLLSWLNESHELDGPPLLHALDNVQATGMGTATKAQREQLERIVARFGRA
jgi:hypothetical protein